MLTLIVNPDVVLISSSSDEDGNDEINLHQELDVASFSPSSEDHGDDVRNLDQQPESEHSGDYRKSDDHEFDQEEGSDVEKSVKDFDECDERRDWIDCFNQGSDDLEELSLYECKTYLRKHGMRVSGTKEECIQRIKEHGRLKDGRGESLYPMSSFSINCTGDACKGDVLFFKQDICNRGSIVGRRTVAGRIVKESYGALRQQHTFSVEVLWSKRSKKLNPLSILLVKGRNLYKFGTFRQPWKNEAERSEVLREKHSRGDAARHKRKSRHTEFAYNNIKGAKRQKVSHRGPSQTKQPTHIDDHKSKQLTFHPDPSPNPNINANPNSYVYPDHHEQEVSSSNLYDRTLLPNLQPLGFPAYGHYNYEQQELNCVFCQPPGHHHCNYEQSISRLKDGGIKSLFPTSSFSINCTGDACKGDVVLFKQHVYKQGKVVGRRRSVAGRIVKESYGASKKQHTFTVEVLWTKKNIKLPPLSTLVVKSRDLCRFGTFRQPWKNEAERLKVLGKKQRRKGAGRRERKLRKRQIASNNGKGVKHQQVTCRGSSQSKQKFANRQGAGPVTRSKTAHKRKAVWFQKRESKKSAQLMFPLDPNPALDKRQVAAPVKKSTKSQKRKAVWFQKTGFKRSTRTSFLPDPNPDLAQIDKQKSSKRQVEALVKKSTTHQKRKAVWFQKMGFKMSTKPSFHPDLNPYPNPNPHPNPAQIYIQKSTNGQVAALVKKSTTPQKRKAVWFQKTGFNRSTKPSFHPDPTPNPDPAQIDIQKSAKRPVAVPGTTPQKTEAVWFQETNFKNSTQPTIHPNPNHDCYIYSDQLQETSSYSTSLLHNPVSPRLLGYGHYNSGQWGPNNAFNQPPGYPHYNYQQPVPRYWLS